MSIIHLLNKSILIRRLKSIGGFQKGYTTTGTVDAHIQRIEEEDFQYLYGVYGATHKCWIALNTNILRGDKVIDPDGNEYIVVAVDPKDYGTMVQHKELILKIENAKTGT